MEDRPRSAVVPEDRAVDFVGPQPLFHSLLDAVAHWEADRCRPGGEAVIHKVHTILQGPWPDTQAGQGSLRPRMIPLYLLGEDPSPQGSFRRLGGALAHYTNLGAGQLLNGLKGPQSGWS